MSEEIEVIDDLIQVQAEIRDYFLSIQSMSNANAMLTKSERLKDRFTVEAVKAEQKVIATNTTLNILKYHRADLAKQHDEKE